MAVFKPAASDAPQGILQPLLEHRFIVQYRSKNMTPEQLHVLSKQTSNFKMDFKNKHISFEIEQAASGDMMSDIQEFVSHPMGVTMHTVDGSYGTSVSRTQFSMLECVSHELVMDYAKTQSAKHRITMKYLSITTKE